MSLVNVVKATPKKIWSMDFTFQKMVRVSELKINNLRIFFANGFWSWKSEASDNFICFDQVLSEPTAKNI